LAGRTIGQPAPGVELAVAFAEREGGDDMKGGSAGEARRAGPDRRGAAGEAGHNSVLINRGDDQVVRRPGDCHTTHDRPVLVGEVCRVLCPSSEVEGRVPGHRQLTRMNARRTILSAPDENYESSNQPQVNRCLAHTPSLEPPRPSWPPRPSAFPPSRLPPQLPDNRFRPADPVRSIRIRMLVCILTLKGGVVCGLLFIGIDGGAVVPGGVLSGRL